MSSFSSFHNLRLLIFSCLFSIAAGCEPSTNYSRLQPQESKPPSLEAPRSPTLSTKEVILSKPKSFSEKSHTFRVPAYTHKNENGRPVIIKAKMSTGKFEIVNNCLVFMNESNRKIGAVLLGPDTYVSEDRAFIIVSPILTVPIGKRLRVGGYIQGKSLFEAEYLKPAIPKTCPDFVIDVGEIHEIKE